MAIEIVDLTDSPPSSPRSSETPRILNLGLVSTEKTQFEKAPMPLWDCKNPNLCHTCHTISQQTTIWLASGHIYEPSQIVTGLQPNIHCDQVAMVLELVPYSNAFLFPRGARFRNPWTPRDHKLLFMGLIKYGSGRGCWTKITKNFLSHKTPQQVQRYVARLFRHLQSTNLYSFGRRNPIHFANNLMTGNWNTIGASASYPMPMIVNQPEQIFSVLPNQVPFFLVPPSGEANTNTITYGFQMQTSGASTSMNASANEEVDLELRLG
ncbi:uncharacterized protein LOC133305948 [Gastrolobium bilobum]|uniref:uncharacterized protein LOC133305948 n=1 Tax=Gastrolobium bilobum TaxID=150636 RepID=UPI002AB1002B|nr:uncharacterized protein LOC133305948 [Gastrolobium bilobum]